jgi:hypothetical protein
MPTSLMIQHPNRSKLPLPVIMASTPHQDKGTSARIRSTLRTLIMPTSPAKSTTKSMEHLKKTSDTSSSREARSNSLKRSSSLRRAKNKDNTVQGSAMTRSGTGGSLDRTPKRSHSINGSRRFRDRDLNFTISRGVQTQLTKDPLADESESLSRYVLFT